MLAKGVYGAGDLQSDFRIGRNQTVQIAGAANRLIVERSGTVVAGYPASLTGGQGGNAIPSGIYTVQETLAKRVFNPPGSGTPLVTHWVVRLSNGGEFVEALTGTGQGGPAAPVGVGVNLSGADAKAYFETVLRGAAVQVVNTGSTASVGDTGSDWSIQWEQWTKLSGDGWAAGGGPWLNHGSRVSMINPQRPRAIDGFPATAAPTALS